MSAETKDPTHEFMARMLPNQHAIRNFIYSIHPHAGDLDDIMQDAAISLWEKFDTFDTTREFLPWAMRLAYFEVLRFRKKRSRDRLVFSDELVDILASEEALAERAEPLRNALDHCLCRLDSDGRAVLEARYGRDTSIMELAESRRESVHKLYRLLEKSRLALVSCVRRQMLKDGLRIIS